MAEFVGAAVARVASSLPFIGVGGTLTLALNGRITVLSQTWQAMTKNVASHKETISKFDSKTPENRQRRILQLAEEGSHFLVAIAGHVHLMRKATYISLMGMILALISAFLNLVTVFKNEVVYASTVCMWAAVAMYLIAAAIGAIEVQISFINLRREGRYMNKFIRASEHELSGSFESPVPSRKKTN